MTSSTPTEANPFPPRITEDQFLAVVIRMANAGGWLVMHVRPSVERSGKWATAVNKEGKGYPDLTLARAGEVLFRELKTNTGRLSPEQETWGLAMGLAWDVWRPRDYERIKDVLRRR